MEHSLGLQYANYTPHSLLSKSMCSDILRLLVLLPKLFSTYPPPSYQTPFSIVPSNLRSRSFLLIFTPFRFFSFLIIKRSINVLAFQFVVISHVTYFLYRKYVCLYISYVERCAFRAYKMREYISLVCFMCYFLWVKLPGVFISNQFLLNITFSGLNFYCLLVFFRSCSLLNRCLFKFRVRIHSYIFNTCVCISPCSYNCQGFI